MLRSFWSMLRRVPLLLFAVGVFSAGLFGVVSVSEAGNCNCLCQGPGGATAPSAASCSTDLDCNYTVCRNACIAQGSGFLPGVNGDGRRVYSCVGGVNLDDGLTQEEEERLDRALEQQRTQTQTPSGQAGSRGGGTPSNSGTATPTQSTVGGSEGGLRFTLPTCTENGNCSLTDIINTGIRAANFLLALSGLVFLATVLWAGAQLIFFAQDAKSIGKAQAMLTSASMAMIIIMVAGVAVRFVSSSLQVTPSLLEAPGRSTNSPRGAAAGARDRASAGGESEAGGTGIQRPPSNGPQGTCQCSPSGLAGLFARTASSEQISQARSYCEAPPINGRFDGGELSCTATATQEECSLAEREINRSVGSDVVSCSWN